MAVYVAYKDFKWVNQSPWEVKFTVGSLEKASPRTQTSAIRAHSSPQTGRPKSSGGGFINAGRIRRGCAETEPCGPRPTSPFLPDRPRLQDSHHKKVRARRQQACETSTQTVPPKSSRKNAPSLCMEGQLASRGKDVSDIEVLVIDRNPSRRQSTVDLVGSCGYQVSVSPVVGYVAQIALPSRPAYL